MNAEQADALLATAREGQLHIDSLPSSCRPMTRADGYAVQALLEHRTSHRLFGWKIAATSKAGQAHIRVSGPMAGRLLKERVIAPGVPISLHENLMAVAEPEFAFVMGSDLPPRALAYTTEEVGSAVQDLHLAVEIPDSRFREFVNAGEAQLIADNACAYQFVLGPKVEFDWRTIDLSQHRVHAKVAGKERSFTREGVGANVLDDPRLALTWLANELSGLGIPLRAGQTITTGTCMVPLEVLCGDCVTVDYGLFGGMQVDFE